MNGLWLQSRNATFAKSKWRTESKDPNLLRLRMARIARLASLSYRQRPLCGHKWGGSILKRFVVSAIAASMAMATSAVAQTVPWSFEVSAAKAGDLKGAELGLGYSWTKAGFRLTPVVGALVYKGDNDRYSSQTLSNGNTICRDRTNGQFADKDNCNDLAAKAYGKIEAAYRFEHLEIGGGVRISSDTTPYGLIGLDLNPGLQLKGFGGKDYYGAGLTARF